MKAFAFVSLLTFIAFGCASNPSQPSSPPENDDLPSGKHTGPEQSVHEQGTPERDMPGHDRDEHGTGEDGTGEDGTHAHPEAGAHHGVQGHEGHGKPGLHLDFSDVERYAKRFDGADRDAWQKPIEVMDVIGLAAGHTVVDLGAGTGYFLPYLSERVGAAGRVLALDVEPNMVEYMKRRTADAGWSNVEVRVTAPDTAGLPDNSVDRILIVNTWHHIDDRVEYGKKLKRALKAGGILAIVDFTLESKTGPPPSHRLSEADVGEELHAAGFQARVAKESLPDQYVVLGSRTHPAQPRR